MSVSNNSLLEVEGLCIQLGKARRKTSFQLAPGGILWIMGPSGFGKTTLLRTVARLLPAECGEIRLNGAPWQTIPGYQWRRRVLYTHQKPTLFPGSVLDNVQAAFRLHCRAGKSLDLELASELLDKLKLPADILERDEANLSGGEAARIILARSILAEPDVLLLDEITAFLDPDTKSIALETLKEWALSGRHGIIAISHDESVRRILVGDEIHLADVSL